MSATRVICAGLVTVDLFYVLDAPAVWGEKQRATGARMIPGGGALNAAAAISALGGHAMLAGAIGDDLLGQFIRAELRRMKIDDTLLLTVPGVASAHSAVLIDARGERTVINHRDDRLFADAPPIPTRWDALLIDTRWRAAAAPLLRGARAAGVPAVVDAEAPLAGFEDILPLASHVAFSEQGLKDFAGDAGQDGLRAAAKRLKTWVSVTRGPRPVLCFDGVGLDTIPVPQVDAKDTLGAGDVWHGAFALALGQGHTEADAVGRANQAASQKVRHAGHLPITQ